LLGRGENRSQEQEAINLIISVPSKVLLNVVRRVKPGAKVSSSRAKFLGHSETKEDYALIRRKKGNSEKKPLNANPSGAHGFDCQQEKTRMRG